MKNKFQLLFILLTIIIVSFPSVCFSEMKTVTGEHCEIYLGDMKNKKEMKEVRKKVRLLSVQDGLYNITKNENEATSFIKEECIPYIQDNYIEKVRVISHTEKGRKICDKVQITSDPEVINRYLIYKGDDCKTNIFKMGDIQLDEDVIDFIKKENKQINIGLVVETKIQNIDTYQKDKLEDKEEEDFHIKVSNKVGDKVKIIDRRNLNKVIEEQKLSLSGITDSDTVKIGKILNLDMIVLRTLYDKQTTTKLLKVDTGEVLFFRTYGVIGDGSI